MRNTGTPLYLWIRDKKSIMNLHENSHLSYRASGNDIAIEMLKRYVSLFKPSVASFAAIVDLMVDRYSTKMWFMPYDIQKLMNVERYQGLVRIEPHSEYEGFTQFAADESEVYKEQQRIERLTEREREKQYRLLVAARYKNKDDKVNIVAVKEKIKVVNRLSKKWEAHYFNVQKKPDAVPKEIADVSALVEIPALHPPGVYFLCQNNKVVYVGQSTNPSVRIVQHQADKKFDRVFLIPTNDLDNVEYEYIKKLKPKYNITHNTG